MTTIINSNIQKSTSTTPATTSTTVSSTSGATPSTSSSLTGNIFQDVLTDVNGVQDSLLGPSYPYWKNIKNPSQLGMSDKGSLSTLAKDINGLINYVELLVSGNSSASATGKPLGNKFFLQTGGKCIDQNTQNQVDRYIYINNVPTGNIPFISSGMDVNFSDFKGLIPGTMTDLNAINPFGIMQAFMSGATPPCQEITLQTIDVNNISSNETHYVSTVDLQNMDPCIFPNGVNPITNKKCNEAFTNNNDDEDNSISLPDDPIVQIYFATLGILGIYILYRIMVKK